jgi:hypothetical protein
MNKSINDKNDFIGRLKKASNIDVDKHSGSYELVREGVSRLAKLDISVIDVCDLEMLFQFGKLGHGKKCRNDDINSSNLSNVDKYDMIDFNERVAVGSYENHKNAKNGNGNCGLFKGRPFTLLRGSKCDKQTAQKFIKMLITISTLNNKDKILKVVENCFSEKLDGFQAGIASQILHLLKPDIFPILNRRGRNCYEEKIGLKLDKATKLDHYIKNTKIIYKFIEDEKLTNINFRTIDRVS